MEINGVHDGTGINFDEYDFTFSDTDATRNLESITIDNGASNHLVVYAVSGAAVPEPSTYAMMIAGLGLLAFGLRLSRHRAALKI